MRPAITLYNEPHAHGEKIGEIQAIDVKKKPDLCIVIGTSLKVDGVKLLVKEFAACVKERGGKVVLINKSNIGKEWDGVFDYHIQGDCDEIVQDWKQLVQAEIEKKEAKRVQSKIEFKLVKKEKRFLPKRWISNSMPRQ